MGCVPVIQNQEKDEETSASAQTQGSGAISSTLSSNQAEETIMVLVGGEEKAFQIQSSPCIQIPNLGIHQ